jgi:hypothetical protein
MVDALGGPNIHPRRVKRALVLLVVLPPAIF